VATFRQLMSCSKHAFWAIGIAMLTGCANMYVDGNTREISTSSFRKSNPNHPVQVMFEFQTKGVANAHVTQFLKARVTEQIKNSGIFSDVSETPVPGGALLSLILNNVPVTDDAFSKGFVTGLTFGLAGSQVTDGYVCTVRYLNGTNDPALVKQARHAIHTTLGASSAPENATKAENAEEAVTLMTRQVISNVLNDLSHDPSFK